MKDYTEVAEFQCWDPAAGGMQVKRDRPLDRSHLLPAGERLPAGKIAAYSDGQSGWIATPQGVRASGGAQLKQVQGDLFRLYFRLLLSDRIAGRTVNAIDDNTVEISDPDGQFARAAFDPETGLLKSVRYETVTVTGPPVPVEDNFSDFREVGGIKVPYKVTIVQGGHKFADVTVTDYQVNTGLKVEDLEKRP